MSVSRLGELFQLVPDAFVEESNLTRFEVLDAR